MDISSDTIINSLKDSITEELAKALINEYISIKRSFSLGHHSPSELAGGRFGEVLVRIFEYRRSGSYTAIGNQLKNTDSIINGFENDGSQDEFFRVFIPKTCRILMAVRNKRNVAHLSTEISPNYQDSLLVMELSTWTFSEIIRLYSNFSSNDAKGLISSINYQHIPIIEEAGGIPKILNTNLGYREKTLLLLYAKYPNWVADKDLKNWTGYANPTRFRVNFLETLSSEALTHRRNHESLLSAKGIREVEKNINMNL